MSSKRNGQSFGGRAGLYPRVATVDGSTAGEFRPTDRATIERRDREAGLEPTLGVPDRDAVIKSTWDAAPDKLGEDATRYQIFLEGFDAGERFGYTFGFHNGGATVSNQLLAAGRGQRYLEGTRRGNEVGRPRTSLEEHTQDQLTAEIVGLMTAYAILPVAQRARALLDALRALPGVNISQLSIEQD